MPGMSTVSTGSPRPKAPRFLRRLRGLRGFWCFALLGFGLLEEFGHGKTPAALRLLLGTDLPCSLVQLARARASDAACRLCL